VFERLVDKHRATILKLLYAAVALSVALPLFGPRSTILLGLSAGLLGVAFIPVVYYMIYLILRIQVRDSYTTTSALRQYCTLFTVFPALFILSGTLLQLYNLFQGGPAALPTAFCLGAPLAAERIWSKHIAEST